MFPAPSRLRKTMMPPSKEPTSRHPSLVGRRGPFSRGARAGKGSRVKRGAILLAVAISLICSASPAAAKGNVPTRAYAIVTGPGLSHPIVFVASWRQSVGGLSAGEGELFLGLAGASGALPAGKVQPGGEGDFIPSGVLPIDEVPSRAARGLRYRLTWFRDGVEAVAKQNIYPYAEGLPLVYTFPSSRRALIVLFGRFQAPAHLWTGWGRATSLDLRNTLVLHGLPTVAPAIAARQEDSPTSSVPAYALSATPATGSVAPAPQAGPVLAVVLASVTLLVGLPTAFHWIRRRSRETCQPGGRGLEDSCGDEASLVASCPVRDRSEARGRRRLAQSGGSELPLSVNCGVVKGSRLLADT